jgi:RNA polymerase sigma-70 factor, ECF subfamily
MTSSVERQNFDANYLRALVDGNTGTERNFVAYFGELLSIKLRARRLSAHVIDDITQETFLRVLSALRRKGGIQTPEALGSFVNSVCNNVLLETYRAHSRTGEAPEDRASGTPSAETQLVDAQERERVRNVLSELPEKDRLLLRWLFFEERDKGEVCRKLKVDREYLRVLVHRAKLRFRSGYLREAEAPDAGRETERRRATPRE